MPLSNLHVTAAPRYKPIRRVGGTFVASLLSGAPLSPHIQLDSEEERMKLKTILFMSFLVSSFRNFRVFTMTYKVLPHMLLNIHMFLLRSHCSNLLPNQ